MLCVFCSRPYTWAKARIFLTCLILHRISLIIPPNTQGTKELKTARKEGRFHEEMLDRREKQKSDRWDDFDRILFLLLALLLSPFWKAYLFFKLRPEVY